MQNKNTIQQTITQEETIENQLLTAIKNHDLYTVISLNLSKEFVEKQSGGQRQSFLHAAAYF